jgi:hypothetical protein
MITEKELKERLQQLDEISLLELLEINSEELVNRFGDKIEDRFEELSEELE